MFLFSFLIDIFVFLLALYYLSVIFQVIGVKVFKPYEFKLSKAFIPFYYWKNKYWNETYK